MGTGQQQIQRTSLSTFCFAEAVYRVTRDDQGNLTSDPNRLDDEQYIFRLIAQVITVSLETTKITKSLPKIDFD